ncbi:HAD family hydrolase [Spiroplasma clarkii]|uniref:HAD family hydrolase n=1 Tax=Spiroplasma clarkii TaxID=2139 RepID=UPI0011BAC988|nr:HAD-IIB family hydrolase [Spiroplasma clarkii]
MGKIVYLDLDGTILNSRKEIGPVTKQAIIEIQKQGIKVAFATGRNFEEIKTFAKILELDKNLNYAICSNGAYITTTDVFNPFNLNLITVFAAKKVYELLTAKQIPIYISSYLNQGFILQTIIL